ncbi:T9SS type A sorting domain-containing protein [Flavobacterium sp.]|uniref:poly(ethylene terephthalate) hydrolase family protein n=1 Tax=Flavobacterium sp. TaxID=239 RepID=UPI0037534A6C
MKHYTFSIIVCLFLCSVANSQTYQIGHTTVNFIDTSRSNRSIATEIYYPADVAGDNVAITSQNTIQFPSLVFGHGFVMTWDAYQNFWNALVPNGYIIAFPKTEGSFSPSHLEYGKDLAFVINQMNFLGTQLTSIFYNRVSSMNSVMGHSMGGGSSFLSVQLNSNIKTIVNFASAETNPSAIAAAGTVNIPSLIFAGANDCVSPPSANQLSMYNSLVSSCKTYVSIIGASHCQMANSNALCSFGESTCSPTPTITRTAQHAKIFSYLIPWLDYQLKANCSQGNVFDNQITTDSSITFLKNCIQCNNLNSVELNNDIDLIVLFPNPSRDFITIKGFSEKEYLLKIFDINSKVILEQSFTEVINIDTSKYSSGVYFYEIIDTNNSIKKGKFIKQ